MLNIFKVTKSLGNVNAETEIAPKPSGDTVKLTPGDGRQWVWKLGIQIMRKNQDKDTSFLILRRFGTSVEPLISFIHEAEQHHITKHGHHISIRVAEKGVFVQKYTSKWCWRSEVFRPGRDLDTVYLGAGMMDALVKDLENHLLPETEAKFRRRGIPYRRGYLLEGTPRSGKSTTIVALAQKFRLPIRTIALNDKTLDDGLLGKLFETIPHRCILVLEDIDAVGKKRLISRDAPVRNVDADENDDDAAGGGVSLSGLLNAIDGVFSPDGYIIMMTTNRMSALDHALIGPGRVDYRVKFGRITKDQAKMFFRSFLGDTPKVEQWADKFGGVVERLGDSPAKVQNYLMKYGDADPEVVCNGVESWSAENPEDYSDMEQSSEAKHQGKQYPMDVESNILKSLTVWLSTLLTDLSQPSGSLLGEL